MKLSLIISIFAFVANAQAMNCTQQEAQFIGKVREVRIDPLDQNMVDCYYKIDFSQYNPSMVCPLDIEDAYYNEFLDTSCSLKKGDEVSGVMVKKDGSLYIE